MSTVALTEDTFEDTLTGDKASDAERATRAAVPVARLRHVRKGE